MDHIGLGDQVAVATLRKVVECRDQVAVTAATKLLWTTEVIHGRLHAMSADLSR